MQLSRKIFNSSQIWLQTYRWACFELFVQKDYFHPQSLPSLFILITICFLRQLIKTTFLIKYDKKSWNAFWVFFSLGYYSSLILFASTTLLWCSNKRQEKNYIYFFSKKWKIKSLMILFVWIGFGLFYHQWLWKYF